MVSNFLTKTKCIHFCQSRKLHLDSELTLDDVQIEVVPEFKFLGLLFYINYLSNKCQKALNLLRVVSSMGSRQKSPVKII